VLNAFVFLNTQVGCEADVLREIRKIPLITEALLVYGAYDIVLRIQSESLNDLRHMVAWKIRKLDYITATQTLITN
jgi:DNA-binding Lrp family transcriptional regulator